MNILETKRNSDTACSGSDVRGGGLLVGTGIRPYGLRGRFTGACALLCALLLSLPLLSSCIGDEMADCAADGGYTINLTISAGSLSTRASGHEPYEEGIDAEGFINIGAGDYAVFIFDGNGDYVQRFEPGAVSLKQTSGGKYKYELNGSFKPERELEKIQIMVLANWMAGFGGSYLDFENKVKASSSASYTSALEYIYKNTADFNFTMPHTQATDGTYTSWKPLTSGTPSGIPMFGISQPVDLTSLGDNALIKLTGDKEIPMLRSLAKVEIVDNMPSGNGITGVTLSKSSMSGRFIPDVERNPDWNLKEMQVVEPSLPAKINEIENLSFFKSDVKRLVDGVEKDVWVAYIPEMNLASKLRDDKERPHFTISRVSGNKDVKFDNYIKGEQNTANQIQTVLRNHIYRYTVEGTATTLDLTLEVLPWKMEWEKQEFHFDNPQIKDENSYLTWDTEGNNARDHKEDMRLYMMAGRDSYVEGIFTLSAPLHAKWYASLVPLQGNLDAFSFVPGYESGTIDGTPCTVRIRNNSETVADEHNEARLVIMVEYPDKTQKEAIVIDPILVTPDDGSAPYYIRNYTIVQELSEIM